MLGKKSSYRKPSSLLIKFSILYVAFALVPFLLLFILYTYHSADGTRIDFPASKLELLIILVGVAGLMGFFSMRGTLMKIVKLSENLRQSLMGKVDKDTITELIQGKGEGEVTQLAKSFGEIFNRLEDNINRLEDTKKTLHDVLSTMSRALSSNENFDILVKLVLKTAIEALGAKNGAIFFYEENDQFILKAWFGKYVAVFYCDDEYFNANIKLKDNCSTNFLS